MSCETIEAEYTKCLEDAGVEVKVSYGSRYSYIEYLDENDLYHRLNGPAYIMYDAEEDSFSSKYYINGKEIINFNSYIQQLKSLVNIKIPVRTRGSGIKTKINIYKDNSNFVSFGYPIDSPPFDGLYHVTKDDFDASKSYERNKTGTIALDKFNIDLFVEKAKEKHLISKDKPANKDESKQSTMPKQIKAKYSKSLKDCGITATILHNGNNSTIEYKNNNDKYHRLNGPAKIVYDPSTNTFKNEWYINGDPVNNFNEYVSKLDSFANEKEVNIPVFGSTISDTLIKILNNEVNIGREEDTPPFDGLYTVSEADIQSNEPCLCLISIENFNLSEFKQKSMETYTSVNKEQLKPLSNYEIREDGLGIRIQKRNSKLDQFKTPNSIIFNKIKSNSTINCQFSNYYDVDGKLISSKDALASHIYHNCKIGDLDENTKLISAKLMPHPRLDNCNCIQIKLSVKDKDGNWKEQVLDSSEEFNFEKEYDIAMAGEDETIKEFFTKAKTYIDQNFKKSKFSFFETDKIIQLEYVSYSRIDGPSIIVFNKETKEYKYYFSLRTGTTNISLETFDNYKDYLLALAKDYKYYPDRYKNSEVQIESIEGDGIFLFIDRDTNLKRKVMRMNDVYDFELERNYFDNTQLEFYNKCQEFKRKENVEMKTPSSNDSKFIDTLKHDAKEAAYKSTGDTMAKLTSILLTNGLERIDNDNARILAMMMQHPSVVPVIKMLLGVGMVYAPRTSTNEHALKIAEKMRQSSINDGMNAVADSVIDVFDELTEVVSKVNEPTKQKVRAPALNSKSNKTDISDFEEVPETKHATARR